jgi:hypothetical protein
MKMNPHADARNLAFPGATGAVGGYLRPLIPQYLGGACLPTAAHGDSGRPGEGPLPLPYLEEK